jgi:hypothetical protein
MKLVMLPLIFSIGFIAFENRDKIIDQYNAAYPSDPAKAAALQDCISHDKSFNRLDGDDRQACYRSHIAPAPIAVAPSPIPQYSYSPSGLPGNDIRRQQANDRYHSPGMVHSAQADPDPAPRHAMAPGTQHPGAVAHRVALQPQ